MQDFHVETIRFLNIMLKDTQLKMARAAHTRRFQRLEKEFQGLQHRLCLEIAYAMESDE